EVDLITRLGDTIVFTEVKYRSGLTYGTPGQAVDYRKQRHIIKTALHYIKQKHLFQENVRFDVIELLDSKDGLIANHIENAFLMAF
ncbi:MAG: YraN family protein, partial [Eubacterium sp.]